MDAVEALMDQLAQARQRLMRARQSVQRQRWQDALEEIAKAARDVDDCRDKAVRGAQAAGLSDVEIGRQLGISQPAVSQQWPRTDRRPRKRRPATQPPPDQPSPER